MGKPKLKECLYCGKFVADPCISFLDANACKERKGNFLNRLNIPNMATTLAIAWAALGAVGVNGIIAYGKSTGKIDHKGSLLVEFIFIATSSIAGAVMGPFMFYLFLHAVLRKKK